MPTATADPNGLVGLLCDRPWALERSTLVLLNDLVSTGHAVDLAELRARLRGEAQVTTGGAGGPVAVIPVYGVIDQHPTWLSMLFGGTSVDELSVSLRTALADPTVRAVVLDVNSPGGSVSGITELAAVIRSLRGGAKPIVAVSNPLAASAAYWLAAQCDEVVCTPSGRVGSVGIYTIHQEISRMLDAMGVTTTIISAGDHKVEGNEFEPLSDAAKAAAQGDVNTFYGMFVADVAKGRRVPMATVADTYGQGRAPLAREALQAGMVDRIDTLEGTVARLAASASGGRIRAQDWSAQFAMAVPVHKTDTTDGSWDAGANEKNLPSPMTVATAKAAYAWIDDSAAADGEVTKSDCKFLHHEVDADGNVGAANLTACSSGIGYLNRADGAPGDPNIPEEDDQGVYDHLAGHLKDAGKDAPPLTGKAPFSDRLVALAGEAEALVIHATERARLRTKETRPAFSTRTEAALRTTRAALDVLLGADDPPPASPSPAPAVDPRTPPAPVVPPAAQVAAKPRFRSTQEWLTYLETHR